ncbi:hypothetical protein [Candidatus Nitrotoga arctica]|uniref:Uncharacterized protein n=1 Tax=Candidatus Nitrotoga arctica TaxID=453162 RepID=A0ABM8Z3D4_9PROT|nr:hypothetical protein [Candidatus Nitrotoga arctica]CAG9934321.1 conserved protein of unknown function [Candidatus Nitrotoga arctica]
MSNEKPLRPIASVRTYPTDTNNVICLALTDTNGTETEFIINPEGLNALIYPVLGLASKWAKEPDLKVQTWSGPKNALPAQHIELAIGRTATECALRVFMGEVELTFIIPLDDVLKAAAKLMQHLDKDSGSSIH